MDKPKKWTEVYPKGTDAGNEECKFWKVLARDKDFSYLSTGQIAKKSGLSRKRVEEIISKYTNTKNFNPPLIYSHPEKEDHWGYWQRVPDRLDKKKKTITKKDQDKRIKRHIQGGLNEISLGEYDCGCDKTQTLAIKNPDIAVTWTEYKVSTMSRDEWENTKEDYAPKPEIKKEDLKPHPEYPPLSMPCGVYRSPEIDPNGTTIITLPDLPYDGKAATTVALPNNTEFVDEGITFNFEVKISDCEEGDVGVPRTTMDTKQLISLYELEPVKVAPPPPTSTVFDGIDLSECWTITND